MDPEDELSLEGLPETVDEDASKENSKVLKADLKITEVFKHKDAKSGKTVSVANKLPKGYWDRHSSVNSKDVGKWFFPKEKDK